MIKKSSKKGGTAGADRFVTQTEAARERGVSFSVVNTWAHRGRVRTRDAYGRLLVHMGDVLKYDPTANKGGRPAAKKGGKR